MPSHANGVNLVAAKSGRMAKLINVQQLVAAIFVVCCLYCVNIILKLRRRSRWWQIWTELELALKPF